MVTSTRPSVSKWRLFHLKVAQMVVEKQVAGIRADSPQVSVLTGLFLPVIGSHLSDVYLATDGFLRLSSFTATEPLAAVVPRAASLQPQQCRLTQQKTRTSLPLTLPACSIFETFFTVSASFARVSLPHFLISPLSIVYTNVVELHLPVIARSRPEARQQGSCSNSSPRSQLQRLT